MAKKVEISCLGISLGFVSKPKSEMRNWLLVVLKKIKSILPFGTITPSAMSDIFCNDEKLYTKSAREFSGWTSL
jgi:hypothetical protein